MTRIMVHLGKETLVVTTTEEALPTEKILEEDIMKVTKVTTGEDETADIEVDTIGAMAKDRMISVDKAMQAETTIEAGDHGMETETKTKIIREIIETIVKTENNMRTSNQTDKYCPDLQNFWTNLSQKTCREGGYPCNWPPPQWSIARKCIEKN